MSSLRHLAMHLLSLPFGLALSYAQCSVDTVLVRGRVENPPSTYQVRVQLFYAKDQPGESAEATLQSEAFRIPVEFLTQSTKPLLANLHPKCDRKPKTVVVTLRAGSEQHDQVTLDLTKDFDHIDPTAFTARSEIILNKPHE